MKHSQILLLSLMVAVGGCAANPSAEDARQAAQTSNRISTEELLDARHFQNAYNLIQSLRPHWIQARGPHSISDRTAGQVAVYVDGVHFGGAEVLRQILASHVQDARHLNASEATSRYGSGHSGGAILITTRRR